MEAKSRGNEFHLSAGFSHEIDRVMGNTPSNNNNNNGNGNGNNSNSNGGGSDDGKQSAGSAQAFFSAEQFATYAKETPDEKKAELADFFAAFAKWASKD